MMNKRISRSITISALALLGVTIGCANIAGSGPQVAASQTARAAKTSLASSARRTGFTPSPQAPHVVPVAQSGSPPPAIDLSAYNPPVGNQGEIGSCSAWATGYYLRGWYAKRDGYYPSHGFAAMYTYSQVVQPGDGATSFAQNLDIQKAQGIDSNGDYLHLSDDANTRPNDSERTNAERYKISGYIDVSNPDHSVAFAQWITNTLAAGNPVAIGIPVYPEFKNATSSSWFINTPADTGALLGYHAVFAYGYDQRGVWVENQWGTDWGKNGTAELSWDYIAGLAVEGVSITPQTPPTAWQQLPGAATDISVGADGSVWALGVIPVYGGYGVYHWNPRTWTWDVIDGGAVRIAVGPDGSPWVVNSFHNIWHRTGGSWAQIAGSAQDIGVGANGYVWIVSWTLHDATCKPHPCDGGVQYYTGTDWRQISGGAARIAVDAQGLPWVVSATGAISRWTGSAWSQLPGSGTDIGVGADLPTGVNQPWVIGTDGGVYYWITANNAAAGWGRTDGLAVAVTAGPSGNAWVVNSAGSIFQRSPNVDVSPPPKR
jgi:hypothetical protein